MSTPSSQTDIRAIDVIRKKRDLVELSPAEIDALIGGYTRGEIPDYQVSAWLMAVTCRNKSAGEALRGAYDRTNPLPRSRRHRRNCRTRSMPRFSFCI